MCRVWLFGETDLGQLSAIFRALGTPDAAQWPEVAQLQAYSLYRDGVHAEVGGACEQVNAWLRP